MYMNGQNVQSMKEKSYGFVESRSECAWYFTNLLSYVSISKNGMGRYLGGSISIIIQNFLIKKFSS